MRPIEAVEAINKINVEKSKIMFDAFITLIVNRDNFKDAAKKLGDSYYAHLMNRLSEEANDFYNRLNDCHDRIEAIGNRMDENGSEETA